MRDKFLLAVVAMLLFASGLTAMATPYAVYCEGDLSLHLLDSDIEPTVGSTLENNSQEITRAWAIDLVTPYSGTNSPLSGASQATKVIIEESFKNVQPTDCSYWFNGFSKLTEIEGLQFLNTENVKSMRCMFSYCRGLTSLDLSTLNTANITDMSRMFYECSGLTSLDLSTLNTVNVTDMNGMFYGCSRLTSLDLSSLNTANVINMSGMFHSCTELTSLDLSQLNTANVTDMSCMFSACFHLSSLDLSTLNTSNVTNMRSMFSVCVELSSLDLSPLNTANVTNMSHMFSGCNGLSSLDLSPLNTDNVTDMSGMFYFCYCLSTLDLSPLNTDNVIDMSEMFKDCLSLTSLDLSTLNTDKVSEMNGMFSGCSGLTSLDLSNFNTEKVTNMYEMFYGCTNLASINLSKFNLSNVTNISNMFNSCQSLRSVIFGEEFNDFDKIDGLLTQNTMVFVNDGTDVTDGRINVVVGDKCEHLVFNYGGDKQLYWQAPRDFTADKVTINRTFTKDMPATLYLPFALDAAEYGTFYKDGVFNEAEDQVTFSKLTDAQTSADIPYMFIPNQDFTEGITIDGPVAVTNLTGETEADGLQGVFSKREFTADEAAQKIYYGWANGEFLWAEEGAKVDACRAYFRLPTSAAAKAPARIKAIFGDDATGVNVIDSEADGIDTPTYNLNGQRVGEDYKGILIKKGKKTANLTR